MNDSIGLVLIHIGIISLVLFLCITRNLLVNAYLIPIIMAASIIVTEYAKEANIGYGLTKLNDKDQYDVTTLVSGQIINFICIFGIVVSISSLVKSPIYLTINGVIIMLSTFILLNNVLHYIHKKMDVNKNTSTYRYGMLILYVTAVLVFQLGFLYFTRTTYEFTKTRTSLINNLNISENFNITRLTPFARNNNS